MLKPYVKMFFTMIGGGVSTCGNPNDTDTGVTGTVVTDTVVTDKDNGV